MSAGSSPQEPSLGQLVSNVTSNVSSLVRLEIELARTEIQSQLRRGAAGGGMIALAVLLGFLAIILLSFAAVYGFSYVMPLYAAFLTVAGIYLVIAALLGFVASRQFKKVQGPERAIAQVQLTKDAFAERTEIRAQAKASGLSTDELRARRAADQARSAGTTAEPVDRSEPTAAHTGP